MDMREKTLMWETFPEYVWSDFEKVLKQAKDLWDDKNTSLEKKDVACFLQWTVPAILNACKENEELIKLVNGLSPREKYDFLTKIQKRKLGCVTRTVHFYVKEELQILSADYILNKNIK